MFVGAEDLCHMAKRSSTAESSAVSLKLESLPKSVRFKAFLSEESVSSGSCKVSCSIVPQGVGLKTSVWDGEDGEVAAELLGEEPGTDSIMRDDSSVMAVVYELRACRGETRRTGCVKLLLLLLRLPRRIGIIEVEVFWTGLNTVIFSSGVHSTSSGLNSRSGPSTRLVSLLLRVAGVAGGLISTLDRREVRRFCSSADNPSAANAKKT